MMMGTAGVVVGCVVSYLLVNRWLAPDAWTGFGALAGSWIGGTGNMAATSEMLNTPPEQFGLAVLADNVIYIVWLPILLASKNFADRFNAWANVSEDRIHMMDSAAQLVIEEERAPEMRDYIFLAAIAIGVTWIAAVLAPIFYSAMMKVQPGLQVVLSESTWRILLITTIALALSDDTCLQVAECDGHGHGNDLRFCRAGMGARATIEGFGQAPAFLLGAFVWIFIHGAFCLAGAKLFRVDVHSVAIASAGKYRCCGLGTHRGGIPPAEPGSGFSANGADWLCPGQLSRAAGRPSRTNCCRAIVAFS